MAKRGLLSRGTLSVSKANRRNIFKYQNSPHPSRAGQGQPSCSDRSLSSIRNVNLCCLWGQMQFCEPLQGEMQKHLRDAQKTTASELGYGSFSPQNSDLWEEVSFCKVNAQACCILMNVHRFAITSRHSFTCFLDNEPSLNRKITPPKNQNRFETFPPRGSSLWLQMR